MSYQTLLRKIQRQNHASRADAQRLIGKIASQAGDRTPKTAKVGGNTPDGKNAQNTIVEPNIQ